MPRLRPPPKIKRKPDAYTSRQTYLDKWLASGKDPVPPVVEEPIKLGVEYETEGGTVLLEKQ